MNILKLKSVFFMLVSITAGMLVAFLGIALSGVAHARNALEISVFAVGMAPIAAVAWLRRSQPEALWLGLFALAIGIVLDSVLVRAQLSWQEHSLPNLFRTDPAPVVLWGVLWLGWQVLAGAAVGISLHQRRAR